MIPATVVVERDGETLGVGSTCRRSWLRPGWAETRVWVAPRHRGTGIGSQVRHQLDRRVTDVRWLFATVRGDDPRSLAVARGWGFEPFGIAVSMALHLRSRAGAVRAPAPHPQDVELRTYLSLDDVDVAALDAVMRAADTSPEAEAFMTSGLVSLPVGWHPAVVVAEDGDGRPIGVCVADRVGPRRWHVRLTGVVPSRRGRGIARALKQRLHEAARDHSVHVVTTTNALGNAAITALNRSLGYVATASHWRVRRESNEETETP
jgi:GNAT superfamily N-acetyltransferase